MGQPSLLASTGNAKIDTIVLGIIGVYEHAFPNRVRAYYLTGSQIEGSAVEHSDIDLSIIFKDSFIDDREEEAARQIYKHLGAISPVKLEVMLGPIAESMVDGDYQFNMPVGLKLNSLLLFGEDIRSGLHLPDQEVRTRGFMHLAFKRLAQLRLLAPVQQARGFLSFPLDYPDPDGEFFGYDLQEIEQDGATYQTIASFINSICTEMMTLLTLKTGMYITTKRGLTHIYTEQINDEWGSFLDDLWQKGKYRWRYLIPTDPLEREQLRDLCRRALDFENYYLRHYRDFLLHELAHADSKHRLKAAQRLGLIIYADDEVIAALQKLDINDQPELHKAAEQALRRIQAVREEQGAQASSSTGCTTNPGEWQAFTGSYVDVAKEPRIWGQVNIENDQLWIYVQPVGQKTICTPLSRTRFECKYGLIEFQVADDGSVPSVRVDLIIGLSVTLARVPDVAVT